MSVHRRVCISVAQSFTPDGHTHHCVHDAEPVADATPLVHQCGCGMTWTGVTAAQASAMALPVAVAPNAVVSRPELANDLNRYINAMVHRAELSGRQVDWGVVTGMRLSADWVAGLITAEDDRRVISDITDGRGP